MNATPRRSPAPAAAVRALATAVLAAGCGLAWSQADEEEPPAAPSTRLELTAQPVVRMDFVAQPGLRVEATGWAGGDTHAVGVALGTRFDRMAAMPGQAPQLETSLNVGLRWRSTLSDRRRVDVAAWRRVAAATDEPDLGTRIELQFTSPRSSVALADFGAIGMQLEGNAKVQLRIRSGKPMFYYRSKF